MGNRWAIWSWSARPIVARLVPSSGGFETSLLVIVPIVQLNFIKYCSYTPTCRQRRLYLATLMSKREIMGTVTCTSTNESAIIQLTFKNG